MATSKVNMKKLIEERDRLLREMDAIKNQIAGLERAIQLLDGDLGQPHSTEDAKAGRSNVKRIVLDLLREVGTTGLNAVTACDIAGRRGTNLDRGSVSSLLSRLKREGTVVYDGDRYKLPEFVRGSERPVVSVIQGGQQATEAAI